MIVGQMVPLAWLNSQRLLVTTADHHLHSGTVGLVGCPVGFLVISTVAVGSIDSGL